MHAHFLHWRAGRNVGFGWYVTCNANVCVVHCLQRRIGVTLSGIETRGRGSNDPREEGPGVLA